MTALHKEEIKLSGNIWEKINLKLGQAVRVLFFVCYLLEQSNAWLLNVFIVDAVSKLNFLQVIKNLSKPAGSILTEERNLKRGLDILLENFTLSTLLGVISLWAIE